MQTFKSDDYIPLPYDIARCTGFNSTSECTKRDFCLRTHAEWSKDNQSLITKPNKSPCIYFLEMKHDFF